MPTGDQTILARSRGVRSVLLLSFEDKEIRSTVEQMLPGAAVTVMTKADLIGRSVGAIIRALRSTPFDVAVLSLYGQTVARSRDTAMILLAGLRVSERYLRKEDGSWETVARHRWLTEILPKILVVALLGGIVVVVNRVVMWLAPSEFERPNPAITVSKAPTVLFIRPDLAGRAKAGGSVSHVKGIVNAFRRRGARVVYCADHRSPALPADVEQIIIPPLRSLAMIDELQMAAFNLQLLRRSRAIIDDVHPDIVYQRHALHHFAGGLLARRGGAMHILEMNGSEVWIRSEWSRLLLPGHARAAERSATSLTDRLSVISEGVRDQMRLLGVPDGRMMLAPNGVDPGEFCPDLDGRPVRDRYAIGTRVVVGFVGTFTKWHGTETLCDVIIRDDPALQDVHYLLIGDGDLRSSLQQAVELKGLAHRCTFTGFVPHEQAPSHLAACDILVSPHLGFAGGTPFFGSPTKLFEYMAMGRPIVASAIGQLATILHDEKNALLFQPGDVEAMTQALKRLVADAGLRSRLGAAARRDVVAQYTWDANLDRVLGLASIISD